MNTRQPLKDFLNLIVDDLNIMAKQLVCIMCMPRDQRLAFGRDVDVSKLVEVFKLKEKELAEALKIAAKQAERQKIIEELKEEVKKRDEAIAKIFACFKESEDVLINAIFQANRKLKSIREANRKKVLPMELIKYAHRISASNSVAAPLTWQQGDPQRPYPVEMEMWQGWPERAKERNKNVMDKDFMASGVGNVNPVNLGQLPSAAVLPPGMMFPAGGGSGPGQPTTPIQQQHEFFIRPQQSSGIFPPPPQIVPSSPIAGVRSQSGWISPRASTQHVQGSPRMQQRPPTPMMTTMHASSSQASNISMVRSPFAAGQQGQQHSNASNASTNQQTAAAMLKMEAAASGNIPPNSVEVLSSDSSSSSDSDSQ